MVIDMKLQKKLIEVLEKNDWYILSDNPTKQGKEYYIEINHGTPAGEDWWECIWYDGTINGFYNSVVERYNIFDVDEEVEVWIESRGKNGVPSSIRLLVEDAEYKEKTLEELGLALAEVI
jgi:hypothetical protein